MRRLAFGWLLFLLVAMAVFLAVVWWLGGCGC
jgi:hypothetical protein